MGKKRKRTKAQIEADVRRTGRPPKPPGEKQGHKITIYVTETERAQLETEAKKRGVSLSTLLMSPWRKRE
jgi:hypothetical protein